MYIEETSNPNVFPSRPLTSPRPDYYVWGASRIEAKRIAKKLESASRKRFMQEAEEYLAERVA